MFASPVARISRFAAAAAVALAAVAAVAVVTLLGPELTAPVTVHAFTFYAVTATAYLALPFVRRGDVLMAGIWLVLGAGVAPCVFGQEISATHMFADIAGVLMAAAPIYIARLRQVAQGDIRIFRRRQAEHEAAQEAASEPEIA